MAAPTLQTLKGFRDFLPEDKRKRDFVASKMKETFTLFGFEPLETPTLEYASLLLGKYGVEADKLVYQFEDQGGRSVALRYDQTVPTARVLAQYQHALPKYFRRYQIQNVFRAEKPQKGRFREFTQCDLDIFGSMSTIADAEILACTYWAFRNVGYKHLTLKVNDRNTLITTLKPYATQNVDVFSIIQSIDKLDKMTADDVIHELEEKGLPKQAAHDALQAIGKAEQSENLKAIIADAKSLGIPGDSLQFNPTLARGLDYYTGMIFEISSPDYTAGSLGGGGRYDNLIKQLGGISIPAVGVGIGFDRSVEAADALGIFAQASLKANPVMVTVFAAEQQAYALEIAATLRQHQIPVEVCPHVGDLGKQLKIANQNKAPFVVVAGENEKIAHTITLKNMNSGEQLTLTIHQALQKLKETYESK